jgi:hypothetical protein
LQGAQLGHEDNEEEEKTGDQIYEELTKDVLDEILDQDSDKDETTIAEILDDQPKSLHPAPETQDPSEDTGDSATAPQKDNPNGQGEGPVDDQTAFFSNFNPDAYRIRPKTNFPAPPRHCTPICCSLLTRSKDLPCIMAMQLCSGKQWKERVSSSNVIGKQLLLVLFCLVT